MPLTTLNSTCPAHCADGRPVTIRLLRPDGRSIARSAVAAGRINAALMATEQARGRVDDAQEQLAVFPCDHGAEARVAVPLECSIDVHPVIGRQTEPRRRQAHRNTAQACPTSASPSSAAAVSSAGPASANAPTRSARSATGSSRTSAAGPRHRSRAQRRRVGSCRSCRFAARHASRDRPERRCAGARSVKSSLPVSHSKPSAALLVNTCAGQERE
jgi:hypothetical protein